jgi:hypothetical protein
MVLPGYVLIPFVGGPACGNVITAKTGSVLQEYRVPVPTGRPVDIRDPTSPDQSGLAEAVYLLGRHHLTGKAVYVYDQLGAL